jgi:hypothetical protein
LHQAFVLSVYGSQSALSTICKGLRSQTKKIAPQKKTFLHDTFFRSQAFFVSAPHNKDVTVLHQKHYGNIIKKERERA